MTRSDTSLSIVVPTYNERDNIEPLCRSVFEHVDPACAELLFVDDASPDGTSAAVGALSASLPVRCVVRRNERGLATAVIRGLQEARGELIVVMDADLSHAPDRIPALLEVMRDPHVQMALGSRFVAGGSVGQEWPAFRHLNSWVARALARPLTGIHDAMSGFFCVRRCELDLHRLRPVGYKIALELIVRHGWRNVVEIPIEFHDRAAGESKLNSAEQLRYLRHLARLYGWVLFGRRAAGERASGGSSSG